MTHGGQLHIEVIEARNLTVHDLIGKQDPYVKILLAGTLVGQTKVHESGGTEPVWKETIATEISKDPTSSKLILAVWESDFDSDDDFIGQSEIDLSHVMCTGIHEQWLPIQDSKNCPAGEVHIKLRFKGKGNWKPSAAPGKTKGSAQVRVMSAKQLVKKDEMGKQDPYVKVMIAGRFIGQTKVHVEGGTDPSWHEEFEGDIDPDQKIILEVWESDMLSEDDLIGIVTLFPGKELKNGVHKGTFQVVTEKKEPVGQLSLVTNYTPVGVVAQQMPKLVAPPDVGKRVALASRSDCLSIFGTAFDQMFGMCATP
eukprot:CAMPEP_0114548796 /NCGR_PEP_ID=MMETSP0114-20121206/5179_1 /TAXON_ID=31324 /ORGANISM="Goniomonas sp, Strain m" /LENGTH=310 /DNA_ID=CAMNT_0001733423 /DNA_START=9 /DNA_END=938 /DNA_ORIENTATION=+